MKKLFFISAGLLVIVLGMAFLEIIDLSSNQEVLAQGNQLYTAGKYKEALEVYSKALEKNKEDPKLYYNLGQTAYRLEDYQQAMLYYNNGTEKVERYLHGGNSNFKLGNTSNDINQKLQYYQQALETYQKGILNYPQEISLKYNYEYVKKKMDELKENNQDQQQKDKQEQDNKNKENKKGDQEQESQQQNDAEDRQKEDNQHDQDQDQENTKEDNNENKQTKDHDQKDKDSQSTQEEQKNTHLDQSDKNSKEIDQVLRMLEKQEQDSLKNNQNILDSGKEEKYDW